MSIIIKIIKLWLLGLLAPAAVLVSAAASSVVVLADAANQVRIIKVITYLDYYFKGKLILSQACLF